METNLMLKQGENIEQAMPTVHGQIIASGVALDVFLDGYEHERVEWVDGKVIQMPGVDVKHSNLSVFFYILFRTLLEVVGGGAVYQDPMLMKLEGIATRAPDIQVLLPQNMEKYRHKKVNGPADLVVEIVSAGSQMIDRVDKLKEYERGGVLEYWIVDPAYQEALFFQRNAEGQFERVAPDEQGVYTSKVLPMLRLPVALLWQETLPTIRETLALVDSMVS